MYLLKQNQGTSARIKALYETDQNYMIKEPKNRVIIKEVKPKAKVRQHRTEANLPNNFSKYYQQVNNEPIQEELNVDNASTEYIKQRVNVNKEINMKTQRVFDEQFEPKKHYQFTYSKIKDFMKDEKNQNNDKFLKQFNRFFYCETVQQLKLRESLEKNKQKIQEDEYVNGNWLTLRKFELPYNKKDFQLRFRPKQYFQKQTSIFDETAEESKASINKSKNDYKEQIIQRKSSVKFFNQSIKQMQGRNSLNQAHTERRFTQISI